MERNEQVTMPRPALRFIAKVVLLLVFVVSVLFLAQYATSDAATKGFSVATWNVSHDNTNLAEIAALIRKMDADLICLQEPTPDAERMIRSELNRIYAHMHFGSGGQYADGFGVLSKFPFTRTNFLAAKHGLFGAWIAEVTVGGRNVQIANLHLCPPDTRRLESLLGAAKMFEESDSLHLREVEPVWKSLASGTPTIVLGDFNDFASSSVGRFLSDRGLIDSFGSTTTTPDARGTWSCRLGERELS
ncbi:MAG TPA: endonuclease/exonuclease/phosphatase family protein, partial [Verrucomicrobiae bacterium]|nr:endonuclease/exonuclease/phosphatase family protein [Verrucomicrobiae bacterium]